MSHLSRELDRQLVWIEQQAQELQLAVEQLVSEGNALMNNSEGWDEGQADTIRSAIDDWADDCGLAITHARSEVDKFCAQLARVKGER